MVIRRTIESLTALASEKWMAVLRLEAQSTAQDRVKISTTIAHTPCSSPPKGDKRPKFEVINCATASVGLHENLLRQVGLAQTK